jgi:hypothetical protein
VAENTPCRDRYSWPVNTFPGQNAPQAQFQHRDCASPVAFSVAENDPRAIAVGSPEHS